MLLGDNSMQLADTRLQQIIDTISSNDQDALKAMFSEQALSEADDFDKELADLFSYIQGSIQSWKSTGAYTFPEKWNDGNHKKEAKSTYIITTNEQDYKIAVSEYTIDTANPDNVGLYSLCIVSEKDDPNPGITFWGSGKVGITIGK